jgi:hypothetical protein
MPISVSRKLQALRDLLYPDLDLQVRRAALTAEQANALNLPSTPLKDTEKRADNWKAKTGREQTELDALIALAPEALQAFALEATQPFFDAGLASRVLAASEEWHIAASRVLASHPKYRSLAKRIKDSHAALESAASICTQLDAQAHDTLSRVKSPPVRVPEPEPIDDGVLAASENFRDVLLAQSNIEPPLMERVTDG